MAHVNGPQFSSMNWNWPFCWGCHHWTAIVLFDRRKLGGFYNQTWTNATSADFYASYLAIPFPVTHRLKVGIPDAFGFIVCVADVIAFLRRFSTKLTSPHDGFPFQYLCQIYGWRIKRCSLADYQTNHLYYHTHQLVTIIFLTLRDIIIFVNDFHGDSWTCHRVHCGRLQAALKTPRTVEFSLSADLICIAGKLYRWS